MKEQNNKEQKKPQKAESPSREQRAVSSVLADGRIVELTFDPKRKTTAFAVWDGAQCHTEKTLRLSDGSRLAPYSPNNNLISNGVVLLPSGPEEYGSSETLLDEVRRYIHRYVDLSPRFERLASVYVLLSWVHDSFNELPYLRLRGDFGSGKTRFLLTVGALCYKPIFASGASTISPIFHTLDAFRGTLVLDEGDFRFTDEKAEIVKILNNGNVRGMPVLRTEINKEREFNPRAFHVFGPKLIATRGSYDDRALESRCLTEDLRGGQLRDDIPISLSSYYHDEARSLRNKLLLYRFRKRGAFTTPSVLDDTAIEPRLRQIFAPLMSVAEAPALRDELQWLARSYSDTLAGDRAQAMEAAVLGVIGGLLEADGRRALPIKDIASSFADLHGEDYGHVSARAIGSIVRQRLGLVTRKSQGNFVIPPSELPKLASLYKRHGLADDALACDQVDVGDIGDILADAEAPNTDTEQTA